MKRFQQLLALAGVVIVVGMILVTLFFAVTGSPWFMASMLLTLTLPLLIYAYLFIYRLVKGDPGSGNRPDSTERSGRDDHDDVDR